MRRAIVGAVLVLALAACSADAELTPTPEPTAEPTAIPAPTPSPTPVGFVEAAAFGDEWPFTFDRGILVCDEVDNGPAARIRAPDNVEYALNGVAITFGFPELTMESEVWLDDPSTGAKVSVSEIIALALELC